MDYYTVLTDAGRALEAAALAGNKTYTLAICALGDGDGLPDPTRTRLQNEVWRGPINTLAPDVNNPTWLLIETHVPPESGGFTIREFGIYTDDGILFAIGNHPEIYKPTLEEGTGIDLIVRPICAVSNATSVTLLTDPTVVMASKKYVDDRIIYNDADLRATLVPLVRKVATTAPLTGGGALSDDLTLKINEATETALGVVERATDAEASAGTDITRYVTPKHLASLRTTLVPTVRTITTTAPLTGGGVLSDNLTLKINGATETALGVVERATDAEASAGTDITRYVTPKHLASAMGAVMPFVRGMIMMWSGTVATIPAGWALCDGVNGAPDLRNRFVIGAGTTYAVGATGGAGSATTSTAGAHAHNVSTGATTLAVGHMAYHNHSLTLPNRKGDVFGALNPGWDASDRVSGTSTAWVDASGGNVGHTHAAAMDSQGNHTHTVATLPPYYALCFIMKL